MMGALFQKLPPLRPPLRPADLGYKVTVCIGALCEQRKKIVVVCDSKVSYGDFSIDDLVTKVSPVWEDWTASFAGNDIDKVDIVFSRARNLIVQRYREANGLLGASDVPDCLDEAYRWQLRRQIEARVLSRYGLTAEKFLSSGKRLLTERQYDRLCQGAANEKLSLQFLVTGFDEKGCGHIYVIDGENTPACYDSIGFCAIGTGAYAASSSLAFDADKNSWKTFQSSVETTVYCACAAKFMAESATDVGNGTWVMVLEKGRVTHLWPTPIDEIRKLWSRSGAQRIPRNTRAKLSQMVVDVNDRSIDLNVRLRAMLGENRMRQLERAKQASRKSAETGKPD